MKYLEKEVFIMYIIKNAIKSITRSKGRNILIGIIIVIIAVSSCVSLSIKNSAAEIVTSYEESFEITASIGINRLALREKLQLESGISMRDIIAGIGSPGIEEIEYYGDSEYLNGYTYILSVYMNADNIIPLTNEEADENATLPGKEGQANPRQLNRGDFNLKGYNSMQAMSEFISGTFQVTEGSMFDINNTENLIVISNELAGENNIGVGDTVNFVNPGNTDEIYEFEIVGIFTDNTVEDAGSMNWFANSANTIITTYSALNNIKTASENTVDQSGDENITFLGGQLSSVFYLKDNSSLGSFVAELREKGLDDIYTVTTNISKFEASIKPLTNLNNFATIFLILVLIIGGVILFILNMINIRERKYEVGVLRAIGMKKKNLALQFVAELLIVTFISISLGATIGAVASVPTANMMLQSEIESMESKTSQLAENFGRGEDFQMGGMGGGRGQMPIGGVFGTNSEVNYISQINAAINFKVILQLMLIGILLTAFSSIISIVLISRYEPLKILSERS